MLHLHVQVKCRMLAPIWPQFIVGPNFLNLVYLSHNFSIMFINQVMISNSFRLLNFTLHYSMLFSLALMSKYRKYTTSCLVLFFLRRDVSNDINKSYGPWQNTWGQVELSNNGHHSSALLNKPLRLFDSAVYSSRYSTSSVRR